MDMKTEEGYDYYCFLLCRGLDQGDDSPGMQAA